MGASVKQQPATPVRITHLAHYLQSFSVLEHGWQLTGVLHTLAEHLVLMQCMECEAFFTVLPLPACRHILVQCHCVGLLGLA